MLQQLRFPFGDPGIEQGQMNRKIGVYVIHFHKNIIDRHRDAQFLTAFPDQSILPGFPRLHLSANKFPQQSARLMRRTLTGHETISIPNQSSNNLCHVFLLYSN